MKKLLLLIFLFGCAANAQYAPTSAFEALRLLPQDVARRIAIIEGRDGTPVPERWYLVVYDPSQEHHLMEYVVADKRVIAARPVSQFAQDLFPEDVIPVDAALLNSDRAFLLVEQFARANNLRVSTINYRLKKEGVGSTPLWKITCLDESSNPFAGVTLAASNGTIINTSGFIFAPYTLALNRPVERSTLSGAPPEQNRSVGEPDSFDEPRERSRALAEVPSPRSQRYREPSRETRRTSRSQPSIGKERTPAPVAQRPEGLFGTIRRMFSR